ncbi:hypothetical protein [Tessaracoccus rhinocerotis]|uniref:hypothetical protein n=1 Tax=Tessaracoccus rhinocerotis TaxID=1689449 RepID=UPI001FEA52F1|nr:hypothetical protein [Tessaracoccus rhinocerotis]
MRRTASPGSGDPWGREPSRSPVDRETLDDLETQIEQLVLPRAPHLFDEFGIGVDTAAEILIVAGDNPERSAAKPRSRNSPASALSRPAPA